MAIRTDRPRASLVGVVRRYISAREAGAPRSRLDCGAAPHGARSMTPLGAIARGLAAGAVGTLAMDLLLFARDSGAAAARAASPRGSSRPVWRAGKQAPAPAQVGKRLVEGLFDIELPPASCRAGQQHHALGVRDARRRAVRHRRGLAAAPANPPRPAVRRERVARRLCGPARRQALQADLGVRPRRRWRRI